MNYYLFIVAIEIYQKNLAYIIIMCYTIVVNDKNELFYHLLCGKEWRNVKTEFI